MNTARGIEGTGGQSGDDISRTHLNRVLKHVRETDNFYRSLYRANSKTFPMPFFGKPESARVITIGLNPSRGEFIPVRRWPEKIRAESLYARLSNYFSTKLPSPHAFSCLGQKPSNV
jgi:hypothetical protein